MSSAKCFVSSVVLYGSQTQDNKKERTRVCRGIEMWSWRRMVNLRRIDRLGSDGALA